jgi:hypothetical protein
MRNPAKLLSVTLTLGNIVARDTVYNRPYKWNATLTVTNQPTQIQKLISMDIILDWIFELEIM